MATGQPDLGSPHLRLLQITLDCIRLTPEAD